MKWQCQFVFHLTHVQWWYTLIFCDTLIFWYTQFLVAHDSIEHNDVKATHVWEVLLDRVCVREKGERDKEKEIHRGRNFHSAISSGIENNGRMYAMLHQTFPTSWDRFDQGKKNLQIFHSITINFTHYI